VIRPPRKWSSEFAVVRCIGEYLTVDLPQVVDIAGKINAKTKQNRQVLHLLNAKNKHIKYSHS